VRVVKGYDVEPVAYAKPQHAPSSGPLARTASAPTAKPSASHLYRDQHHRDGGGGGGGIAGPESPFTLRTSYSSLASESRRYGGSSQFDTPSHTRTNSGAGGALYGNSFSDIVEDIPLYESMTEF
jgi:hypothetical protein